MRSTVTIAALIMLLSTGFNTNAQVSFSHSVGAALYYSTNAGCPGIFYSPRLNLVELGDELTLSVGTHVGLGIIYDVG